MQYRFENQIVDQGRRELWRDDRAVAVEPQVFDLLAYLVENRDRVLSRDELIDAVWGGRIVSDSTLTSRINAVRTALADNGTEQRLVRTYPRRGFRFIGEVHDVDGYAAPGTVSATPGGHDRSGTGQPKVAVLPFRNLGGDASREYFCDGMTEDIIAALARHRSLLVIARTSSFAFKNREADVRRIGRDLGADYIVDGSIRSAPGRMRISAELIETKGGGQIWAERYDRDIGDMFTLQDEIAATIAARVEPEVGASERLRAERKTPPSLDAWDLLHLGTSRFYRARPDENEAAQRLFRRAIDRDPTLAQAHAYLSYSIVLSMIYFDAPVEAARLDEATEYARIGVRLDEHDGMIRFILGRALLARKSYRQALAELEIALDLNPYLAVSYCGLGDTLTYEGRVEEALPYFDKAIELSPFDPQRWAFCSYRALALLFAGEFKASADWAETAIRVPNCHYLPYVHRASALGHSGPRLEAREAVRALLERKPGFSLDAARERLFYVRDTAQVDLYLDGLRRAGLR